MDANVFISLLMFPSTERFYKSVHTIHQSTSMSPASGMTRCPFRAAIQSKQLHTSAVIGSQTTKEMAAASLVCKGKLEELCEVKRSTKDGHCECAAKGLQPVGEYQQNIAQHCGGWLCNHIHVHVSMFMNIIPHIPV